MGCVIKDEDNSEFMNARDGLQALGLWSETEKHPFSIPTGNGPPIWLLTVTKSLRAVVTDFYDTAEARQVCTWLKWAGFTVDSGSRIEFRQQGFTCGAVAAKVAHLQAVQIGKGSEWWNIPTDQACSTEVWKESYQLVHQQSCNSRQFTDGFKVETLCEHWEKKQPTGAKLPFCRSYDRCFIYLLKDLIVRAWRIKVLDNDPYILNTKITTVKRPPIGAVRQLIANTELRGDGGSHWFSISYST
jgi:hypothetical protein